MSDFQDAYFTNPDGLRQYYRDYGSPFDGAEIMLCLPGLTRNSRDFSHVAEQFRDRFRVIAVDLRGRGKSDYDPKPERYQPLTYVQDCFALLAHLGVEQVHVCATSLGGLITIMMQAMKPGVIKSAIVNDIGPEVDQRGIERIKTYVGNAPTPTTWDEAIAAVRAGALDVYPDFDDAQWEDFTARLFVMKDGRPVADYDQAIAQPFKGDSSAAAPDLWPMFDGMKDVPLLLVRGETSDILAPETVEKMAARHNDFQFVEVANVGHAPVLYEPVVEAAFEVWADRFTAR